MQVIRYPDGIDTEEEWSQSWEGQDHDIGISLIHLSTTKDDAGPPLHTHPYPETIMVRRGRSTVRIGTVKIEINAGQTVVIPANTPHTFRTHGPERYESIAIHPSPTFVTTIIGDSIDG